MILVPHPTQALLPPPSEAGIPVALLRFDVRDHPGILFGFIPEWRSLSAESAPEMVRRIIEVVRIGLDRAQTIRQTNRLDRSH
jgi:hypothetical protein